MERIMRLTSTLIAIILAGCLFYPCPLPTPYRDAKAGEARQRPDPVATAAERIEKLRKADVSFRVVDGKGRPVANAKVKVEMVRHAFLFGCGIAGINRYKGNNRDTYEKEFAELFNYATLPFAWARFEPQPGRNSYEELDPTVSWCKANGVVMQGHQLIWHSVYPAWAPNDPQGARLAEREHVSALVSKYSGVIDRWIVINEARGGVDKAKNGVGNWMTAEGIVRAIGESVEWARSANRKAVLVVNESRASNPDTLQLFTDLVKARTDFDIIGLQSHMHSAEWPLDRVWSICESYSRLGKPLNFTEVTVISGEHGNNLPKPWTSTPEGEARQAEYVEKFYTLLFSHPGIEAITWWDLMDGGYQGAPGGLVRADLSPKPAYSRLRELIKSRWWTNLEARTDAGGSLTFRGFLGDYRVTVLTSRGQRTESFTLQRGQNNWSLRG